jgi:NodT family efflux transporter outer membrane factor (OMF) lipoprotein
MNSGILRRESTRGAWIAASLLAAGCAVGPDFKEPTPPGGNRYDQASLTLPAAGVGQPLQTLVSGSAPAAKWWESFESAPLNDTVDLALRGNPTLEAAGASLSAARETLAAAAAARFPQADASAGVNRGNSASARGGTGFTSNLYSVGAAVSYGVDIFGETRRRIEQQSALVDFQRDQRDAAYLALTGNVVNAAINAAGAQEQLGAIADIIAVDEHNRQLVQFSATAGKSAGTDVLAAEGQLASDRALLPAIRQQLDVARHALAILVGRSPADWAPPEFSLANLKLPTSLPFSLPSDLVRQRPDIRAAEAQLHAASAAVGVATAQLYPSVTLTGSWTTAAAQGSELFDPGSRLWSIAAGITQPLFRGGSLRAGRRAALDTFKADLALYRATVLQAFGQVADLLQALQHDAEALEAQQAAFEASRASLELTQQSFEAGQASFLQILETQRLYQQARLAVARARTARYLDTALFFLALGGDAETEEQPSRSR